LAIVEDKSLEHMRDKNNAGKSGEAEAIAYGIAILQTMDSKETWKHGPFISGRRFSEVGLTLADFTSVSTTDDASQELKTNDDDDQRHMILIRVIGYQFSFYRMDEDESLLRRCWGIHAGVNSATNILAFRKSNTLDFLNDKDREIILKLLLHVRKNFQITTGSMPIITAK